MKHQIFVFAMVLVCVSVLLCAGQSVARGAELTNTQMELHWKRNWKNFARRVVKIGDQYYTLAAYSPLYPSSRGMTIQQLRSKTAKSIADRFGQNVKIRRHLIRPADELRASAEALPELRIGNYGHLVSGEVAAVLGADVMVLEDVWLVDEKKLDEDKDKDEEKLRRQNVDRSEVRKIVEWKYEYREQLEDRQGDRDFRVPLKLIGFSTAGVAKGDRWLGVKDKGFDVAIVTSVVISSRRSSRSKPLLVGIPLIKFNTPLSSETSFLSYLKDRGFDKKKFVDLFVQEHQANPRDQRVRDAKVFEVLETPDETDAKDEGK